MGYFLSYLGGVIVGAILWHNGLGDNERIITTKFAVENGYGEFVPDTTNGTIRFEWIDLGD